MVGGNVDRIGGRDLYSAAQPSRRNCSITIVTPAIYPRFLKFLYVDIQSTGRTLSRPWSRQPNYVMSEIQCAQLRSELFRRRHSTRQSHGLFALAKRLLCFRRFGGYSARVNRHVLCSYLWSIIAVLGGSASHACYIKDTPRRIKVSRSALSPVITSITTLQRAPSRVRRGGRFTSAGRANLLPCDCM